MEKHIKLVIHTVGIFINKIKLVKRPMNNIWYMPCYIPTEIIYLSIEKIYDFTFSINIEHFHRIKNRKYRNKYRITSKVVFTVKNIDETGHYRLNII